MGKIRIAVLVLILTAGGALFYGLYTGKYTTSHRSTLVPAYQLAGRIPASLSGALTKVIPVNDIDEAEFGRVLAQRYESQMGTSSKQYRYLNGLLKSITPYSKKAFEYRVFYADDSMPNAFALPGGVIIVTGGLLKTMKSEAELAAVLSHEMGHIELSHCLDTVRFQLLARKTGSATLGELTDLAVNVLIRHTFSKTQEGDADNYAYSMIMNTVYDPAAVGGAFRSLLDFSRETSFSGQENRANILRDYFTTHPHLEHRAEKYEEKARLWRQRNREVKKYQGRKNLALLKPWSGRSDYREEWVHN